MADFKYCPNPRDSLCSEAIGRDIYIWRDEPRAEIQVYDALLEWWKPQIHPDTTLPSGQLRGASAHLGKCIYVYSGMSDDHLNSLSGNLVKFDIQLNSWSLVALHSKEAPMKKSGCGMVAFGNSLIVFGGIGIPNGPIQPGSEWFKMKNEKSEDPVLSRGITNEMHRFDLGEGKWHSVETSGTRPPPCFNFSFTMIDDHRAMLFGGMQQTGNRSNDVYILDLFDMHWSKVSGPDEKVLAGRSSHAMASVGDHVIAVGGRDNDGNILRDVWIMNVPTGSWKKLEILIPGLESRLWHCASTLMLSPECAEVVIHGGAADGSSDPHITHLKFKKKKNDGEQFEWILTDVADSTKLGTSERIREKVALKLEQINRDVTCSSLTGDNPMQTAEIVKQSAESRLREAEEWVHKNTQKYEEMLSTAISLGRSNRDQYLQSTKDLELTRDKAEKHRKIAEGHRKELVKYRRDAERYKAEAEMLRCSLKAAEQRAIALEKKLINAGGNHKPWLVKRREIIMSNQKLGGGGWGEVWVATFRGTTVAAKVQYAGHRSEFYDCNFTREMDMAAKLHHPNLVQFIGASTDEEMVILMEYMPTSLRQYLQNNAPGFLMNRFCMSVALDVAKALNYLHLMQPDPIVHRDISSGNVLLEPLPNERWRAKVTDYGSVNFQKQVLTNNPGSPIYSAPEANYPAYQTPKMDIFSFGVLLIEICTGQLPAYPRRPMLLRSIKERFWLDAIYDCIQEDLQKRPNAAQIIAYLLSH